MDERASGTKHGLILAAGELFAENGFDGTGIRTIAEKANANVAAINYHFGSKENLYAQALHYAATASGEVSLHNHLPEEDLEDNEPLVSKTVYRIIEEQFREMFSKDRPPWCNKILMRVLFEPPPCFEEIVRKSFRPDAEALEVLALRARPSLSQRQAHLWSLTVFGQLMIYSFAKDAILTILECDEYTPGYIDGAVSHVTRVSVAGLFALQPETPGMG